VDARERFELVRIQAHGSSRLWTDERGQRSGGEFPGLLRCLRWAPHTLRALLSTRRALAGERPVTRLNGPERQRDRPQRGFCGGQPVVAPREVAHELGEAEALAALAAFGGVVRGQHRQLERVHMATALGGEENAGALRRTRE
jgi:hypothetical protein